ncbi:putative transcriptional regulator [Cupriavidus gilardii J11]|uniref:Putative transcriptional regulator n=1 Tax=Cupriavidus gilardii J11 TaxID=936133 RepID=A0A562BV29_9BURK|nr:helix-turn-helix domain-containing protein [Cupriavidus gilardii]TWG88809.1 putative transcriptional regulator [Cupriavidus gilardii J11]
MLRGVAMHALVPSIDISNVDHRANTADDIKRLREKLRFSQPVFAHHLHTTASTVRKWEQGETRPTGPALKLLNVIADKGLQAIL